MAATISASACSVPYTLIFRQRRRFKKQTTNHVGKLQLRLQRLHGERDKEADKPTGFADYAIKLFSGIVTLYNRTLRFALSGQDNNVQNSSMTTTPLSSRKSRSDPVPVPVNGMEISHHSMRISGPCHYSSEEPPPPGVTLETNGYETHLNVTNYDYSRRVFGATLDSISRSRSGGYNSSHRHY